MEYLFLANMRACMRACVCACVRVCVRACSKCHLNRGKENKMRRLFCSDGNITFRMNFAKTSKSVLVFLPHWLWLTMHFMSVEGIFPIPLDSKHLLSQRKKSLGHSLVGLRASFLRAKIVLNVQRTLLDSPH
jgi:hypothetical protein